MIGRLEAGWAAGLAERFGGAALITGAPRRIGLAVAERLLAADFAVALHASPRSSDEAEAAAARLRGTGAQERPRRVVVVSGDLADVSVPARLVAEAAAALGPLSLLVNNAALFVADQASDMRPDVFDRHMAVNLRAPVLLAQAFARQAGAGASIVNVVDQRVLRPNPQCFSYTLAKAALWTATRTMAQAYAPDIRVNAVGPGPTLPNPVDGERGFAREVAGLPLRQAVLPDDIADAILYLVAAERVTGQMIAVDSGQHLGWETPDIVGVAHRGDAKE